MGSLRTLFALAVVFAHSPWRGGYFLVGGKNAVQLFYIISGFLISYVLTEKKSYKSIKTFYISRWLRLWPMYIFVALLTLAFWFFVYPPFFEIYDRAPVTADILLVLSNIFMFGQDWVMFSVAENGKLVLLKAFYNSEVLLYQGLLIPPAWTLGVELSFYLVAPFILKNRRMIVALLTLSILLRVLLIAKGIEHTDPWNYRFFPTELALFLLGALSQQLLLPLYQRYLGKHSAAASACATFAFMALASTFYILTSHMHEKLADWALLSCFVLVVPLAFIFQNTSKLDRKVGELSFPIYIGHMLVINVCSLYFHHWGSSDKFTITMINVLLSIGFAFALNGVIGNKVEAVRNKFKSADNSPPTKTHAARWFQAVSPSWSLSTACERGGPENRVSRRI